MSSPSDPTAPAPSHSGPNASGPNASEADPLLNRVIAGNFRIERLLGAGAMGNVYKAEQLSLGKAVAIKVLHVHLMGDEKLVMRFKREAKSASLLNHPNSIQIIDSGQDKDGTLYIAMELLAGRDLAHVIRDDFPLSLPRIVRIMSQVLSALDEAHAQGVIHRDLKPSNIMLIERRGERDFVKVCDFGIAKAAINEKDDRENMLTIQGLVCGTPEYMAPEQARGEVLDGRADLYAAAVILFQMVTGDIPFKGDTPMAIVSRHLVETPAVPSRRRSDVPIPRALDALILRGMEKNRELRFAQRDRCSYTKRSRRSRRRTPAASPRRRTSARRCRRRASPARPAPRRCRARTRPIISASRRRCRAGRDVCPWRWVLVWCSPARRCCRARAEGRAAAATPARRRSRRRRRRGRPRDDRREPRRRGDGTDETRTPPPADGVPAVAERLPLPAAAARTAAHEPELAPRAEESPRPETRQRCGNRCRAHAGAFEGRRREKAQEHEHTERANRAHP